MGLSFFLAAQSVVGFSLASHHGRTPPSKGNLNAVSHANSISILSQRYADCAVETVPVCCLGRGKAAARKQAAQPSRTAVMPPPSPLTAPVMRNAMEVSTALTSFVFEGLITEQNSQRRLSTYCSSVGVFTYEPPGNTHSLQICSFHDFVDFVPAEAPYFYLICLTNSDTRSMTGSGGRRPAPGKPQPTLGDLKS